MEPLHKLSHELMAGIFKLIAKVHAPTLNDNVIEDFFKRLSENNNDFQKTLEGTDKISSAEIIAVAKIVCDGFMVVCPYIQQM